MHFSKIYVDYICVFFSHDQYTVYWQTSHLVPSLHLHCSPPWYPPIKVGRGARLDTNVFTVFLAVRNHALNTVVRLLVIEKHVNTNNNLSKQFEVG